MVGKGLKAGYRACVGHRYGGGRCVSTEHFFSSRFSKQNLGGMVAQNSEYLLKVCCLGMVNMKSGSLTPKDLHFLCLSPGDLKNCYFALFCRNCRCAPNLYLAQRCYHRA